MYEICRQLYGDNIPMELLKAYKFKDASIEVSEEYFSFIEQYSILSTKPAHIKTKLNFLRGLFSLPQGPLMHICRFLDVQPKPAERDMTTRFKLYQQLTG